MRAAALLLWLAACNTPTGPSGDSLEGVKPWMHAYWAQAQRELKAMPIPPRKDPFSVSITRIKFRGEPEWFMCGSIKTAGCFHDGGPLIRYYVGAPEVIRHEAKHAILWALGDARYHCIEHPEPCPGTGQ